MKTSDKDIQRVSSSSWIPVAKQFMLSAGNTRQETDYWLKRITPKDWINYRGNHQNQCLPRGCAIQSYREMNSKEKKYMIATMLSELHGDWEKNFPRPPRSSYRSRSLQEQWKPAFCALTRWRTCWPGLQHHIQSPSKELNEQKT